MRRPALALLLGSLLLVAGASALDGYEYYQTIEYAACDQEIYQQDIMIHRTTGTAYEEIVGGLKIWHIYVGDHCREDYGDVRFTDSTGAELAYYLWPDYSSESARFAVRLEGATSAGGLTVYYGNPTATTTSNGNGTYLFFDQFDTFRNDVWNVTDGAPPTVSGSVASLVAPCTIETKSTVPIINTRVEVRSQFSSEYRFCVGGSGYFFLIDMPPGSTTYPLWRLGTAAIVSKTPYPPVGSWSVFWVNYGPTSAAAGWDSNSIITCANTPPDSDSISVRHWYQQTHRVDYVLVRAYSATPPAALTFSGEQETASPPVTAFTATPTAGLAPLTVQFTDTSAGRPTSWLWNFGDGGTSTEQNPQHTYTVPGTYTVTLTATNEYGSTPATKLDYITVYAPITAQFTANITGGTAPVTVQFTDLSTGSPTSWLWTFGDGDTSTDQNPTHTYTTAGTHTVTLTASHPYDSDTETKPAYIIVAVLQPFPGLTNIPRDLAGNGLYTDINGNNRLDYNDLTVFFQHLAWAKTAQPIACFDFNGNGWLDYNDVITLFSIITEEHP